jgi:hypothetical protein
VLASGCRSAANNDRKNPDLADTPNGKYPADFPNTVPKPALMLESALGAGRTFTLRFKSTNAKADLAAYKNLLVTACFLISNESNDLGGPSKQATLLASKADSTSIVVRVFAADAPRDCGFMIVEVNPVVNFIPNSINGSGATIKVATSEQHCAT